MTAILFGSISTLSDSSELQRSAFNQAFEEHRLDWRWDRDEYRTLLDSNGGVDRVTAYAQRRGEQVDAVAVHATKSRIFQQNMAGTVKPRPGVVETIAQAKEAGVKLGFVTTTARANVDALLDALAPHVTASDFDVIGFAEDVKRRKPAADAYQRALHAIEEDSTSSIAIEDNRGGVQSARASGLTVVAFPNDNTAEVDFGDVPHVDRLDYAELLALLP